MWENMVGRGRAFSGVLARTVSEILGDSVGSLDADVLYRAVNRVHPSFIRVEADEVTYGMHIILRFELEQDLIEGRVKVAELPEVWNARFKEYFGLDVPDDSQGVLQDVHWSAGLIGYFSTYALGNLIAGQLWEKAHSDIPDLDDQIAAGELFRAARVAARERAPPRRQVLESRSCSSGSWAARSRSLRSSTISSASSATSTGSSSNAAGNRRRASAADPAHIASTPRRMGRQPPGQGNPMEMNK